MRTKIIVGITLGALALGAYLVFGRGEGDAVSREEGTPEERARAARRARRGSDGFDEEDVDDDRGSPRDRLARRAQREREREERFRAQFEIVALGPTPTTITADAVIDSLAEHQVEFETCMEGAGGRDAYLRTMREIRAAQRAQHERDEINLPPAAREALQDERVAARRGRPSDRVMRFDVRPDGSVEPESIELEPQVPEPFAACFVAHILSVHLDEVGADGARVEMPMRGPRRRTGDGGVPMTAVPPSP